MVDKTAKRDPSSTDVDDKDSTDVNDIDHSLPIGKRIIRQEIRAVGTQVEAVGNVILLALKKNESIAGQILTFVLGMVLCSVVLLGSIIRVSITDSSLPPCHAANVTKATLLGPLENSLKLLLEQHKALSEELSLMHYKLETFREEYWALATRREWNPTKKRYEGAESAWDTPIPGWTKI